MVEICGMYMEIRWVSFLQSPVWTTSGFDDPIRISQPRPRVEYFGVVAKPQRDAAHPPTASRGGHNWIKLPLRKARQAEEGSQEDGHLEGAR